MTKFERFLTLKQNLLKSFIEIADKVPCIYKLLLIAQELYIKIIPLHFDLPIEVPFKSITMPRHIAEFYGDRFLNCKILQNNSHCQKA